MHACMHAGSILFLYKHTHALFELASAQQTEYQRQAFFGRTYVRVMGTVQLTHRPAGRCVLWVSVRNQMHPCSSINFDAHTHTRQFLFAACVD
jgi:hypothetical protein